MIEQKEVKSQHDQRVLDDPFYLEKKAAYQQDYFAKNTVKMRTYNREYQKAYRLKQKALKLKKETENAI